MIAAAIVAIAQAGLTFREPAAPLIRLVPALGKAANLTLSVDARLGKEVVLVCAKEVPADEVLKRIASATGGEWQPHEGGLRLTMTGPSDALQRRNEAIARGEARIALWKDVADVLADSPQPDGSGGQIERIMARLPAKTLGELTFGQRIVFSTRPNAMQRPMPPGVLNGLNVRRLMSPGETVIDGKTVSRVGPMAQILLVVEHQPGRNEVAGTVEAYNAAGRCIGYDTTVGVAFDEVSESDPAPLKLPVPNAVLALSPASQKRASEASEFEKKEWLGLADPDMLGDDFLPNLYSANDLVIQRSAEGMRAAIGASTSEPLARFVGEAVEKLADAEGLNLVAVLPDAAYLASARLLSRANVTADELVKEARSKWGVEIRVADGWLQIVPQEPATARDARVDRSAVSAALRALSSTGTLSLEQQIAYAAAQPLLPFKNSLEGPLFAAIDPSWGQRIALSSATGERTFLRLYQALGSGIVSSTRAFSSLSPAARQLFSGLCYGAIRRPSLLDDDMRSPLDWDNLQFGGFGGPDMDLASEPTAYWRRGIPADSLVRLETKKDTGYFGIAPNGLRPLLYGSGSVMTVGEDETAPQQRSSNRPRLARYAKGQVTLGRITLASPDRRSMRAQVIGAVLPASPSTVAFGQLPKALRQSIEDGERPTEEGPPITRPERVEPVRPSP